MTLAHGRSYLAIPGPSVIPDRVLNAMHVPAPDIYGKTLGDMVGGWIPDLCRVARTEGHVAIYACNGHGVWEAVVSNLIAPGDRVLLPATGVFGIGWGEVFAHAGARVDLLDFGLSAAIDPSRVEAALRADTGHEIKAVVVTHVDTSAGVLNDIPALRAVMDAVGHPALLIADCIASLAVNRFEMDLWGVDVAVAASQKGLMTPPGLGFVFFNDKARAAAGGTASRYWDWGPRVEPAAFYEYFCGTAPTHHLFALREALDMIAEEGGVEAVWARHDRLARAIWAAVDAWAKDGALRINIADPAKRSRAVTALELAGRDGTRLRGWVEEKAGVTLGIGIGMAAPDDPGWHRYFRIGHMGHLNAHMVMGALGAIEAGLVALNIAHGKGALSAAAEVIAQA